MTLRSTIAAFALATVALSPLTVAAQDKATTYTRAQLETIIRETLMKDPQIILDAVEQMQLRQQAEKEDQARQVIQAYSTSLLKDKESPVAGNEKADITIVEFFDYNCGYCKRSLPNVMKMLKDDPNVKFVFKEYPVLAPSSEEAARASLAMYYLEPDRYFDFHAALFQLGGKFDEKNLLGVAEGMGADPAEFKKMMQSDRVTKHIEDTRELATKMGAQGVPVFIIGEEMFPGAISYEAMQRQVEILRANKKDKS